MEKDDVPSIYEKKVVFWLLDRSVSVFAILPFYLEILYSNASMRNLLSKIS